MCSGYFSIVLQSKPISFRQNGKKKCSSALKLEAADVSIDAGIKFYNANITFSLILKLFFFIIAIFCKVSPFLLHCNSLFLLILRNYFNIPRSPFSTADFFLHGDQMCPLLSCFAKCYFLSSHPQLPVGAGFSRDAYRP